jgi:hypothetical protein
VTSLTTEAVSFFSCGLRVKGQPGPKDIACGVLVGVRAVSACLACKSRLGEPIFTSCMTARLAAVGRVPGVDFDPYAPSVFRFSAQNRNEVAPARVTDTSVEPGLGRCSIGQEPTRVLRVGSGFGPTQHIGDGQVFHRDQVVASDQLSRGFVVEVPARVGNLAVPRGHGLAPAHAVVRPAHGAAKPLLRGSQPVCRGASPARIINVIAVGGSGKGDDAQIDAGVPSRCRQRTSGDLVAGQDQHPPATFSANLERLHLASHLAVRGDLDLSDALQIYAVGVRVPTRAISIFGPLDGGKPALTFEPWISWLSTAFDPSEISGESSVKPPQGGLLARKRPIRQIRTYASDLTQLDRLIPVTNRGLAMRPGVATFLERAIVKLTMSFHTGREGHMLARRGAQTKLERAPHTIAPQGYKYIEIVRPSVRTISIRTWSVCRTPLEQLRSARLAIPAPYEAPLTNPWAPSKGALWMYV